MMRRVRFRGALLVGILSLSLVVVVTATPSNGQPKETGQPNTRGSDGALGEALQLNKDVITMYRAGKYDAAVPLAERAIAAAEKAVGLNHFFTANAIENLALLYEAKGEYGRAESLYQRGLDIRLRSQGANHSDVARSLNNLAGLYHARGDYSKAEPLYQRALSILEKALGPEHPSVATALNNFAGLYYAKGDYGKAEPMYQRALAIREKALGSDHPDVALLLNNLARLYDAKGDHSEVEPLYQRALTILERALGSNHPDVALLLNNLAKLYDAKGDSGKAEPLYLRALAIQERAMGSEHPSVATSLNNLAGLYEAKGDYSKAEPLYQRALSIQEKALGTEHPDMAISLNNLAGLYEAKGDYSKAERLYRRALSIGEKVLGTEHPDVATSLNNLAGLYEAKGDYGEAERLYQRALSIREKALGIEHPDVATSLNNLAGLYEAKGDYGKAEPRYQRALSVREKALGTEHPDVATSLNNLAGLYEAKGDYGEAERLYQRALSIREKALGPAHPDVAISLDNLAVLYLARGDVAATIRSQKRAASIQGRNAAFQLSGSDAERRTYMTTLLGSTYADVSLHVEFAPDLKEARQLAVTTILNRKGRVLDAMADSFVALRRRLTPEEQARLDEFRSISAEYSALALRGPGKAALDDYRKTLEGIDKERQKLKTDLLALSPELKAALLPVTVEQVTAAIPEGAALVELFRYNPFIPRAGKPADRWGRPRYVAYVLRHEGEIVWVDLGEAAPIEAAVAKFLPTLRRPAADPRKPARALEAVVMQPIRRLLGDTRWVFLSSDSTLNLVPFGALLDEDGRYLVERYAFTYLTSGRDLLRLGTTISPRRGPVIIAAPDFGAASTPSSARLAAQEDQGKRSADMGTRSFGSLAFAAEEGRAVGHKLAGATLWMGAEATESAVKALHAPPVLHIVTHGFFLADQPELRVPSFGDTRVGALAFGGQGRPAASAENPLLRSGLVLAGVNRGQSGKDDGVLTALEASQLDLYGTKLVVLSACETGVGETPSGEGVYGLRRALVIAGAETQVMSLWKVNDAASREQMEAYYTDLLQGGGRSESMRQVQVAMLQDPKRAHPYYWASLIVSGNPAALDGKPAPPDFARVNPGMRGCGCEVGSNSHGNMEGWAIVLAALGFVPLYRRHRR